MGLQTMANKRIKTKGRRERGSFLALPHAVITNENYYDLTSSEVKLFIDLAAQYYGSNNGDFTAAWTVMKKKGWRSKETLFRARKGLVEKGFIVTTREGGRNRCTLYGLTFHPIDECKGKLDINSSNIPLGWWKTGVPN